MSDLTLSPRALAGRLRVFLADPEYIRQVLSIGLPIAAQSFLFSSLNLVGVLMIGQLGETEVAAVGLAGQMSFLFNLILFGITSGASMFTAQLWGRRDIANIRRVLGIGLILGAGVALLLSVIALVFPEFFLGLYSKDLAVVRLGAQYLRIWGWAFPLMVFSAVYGSVLRSIGEVRLPVTVTAGALILTMLLTYLFVFGVGPLPALGVRGAALAALVARLLEAGVLIGLVYRGRSETLLATAAAPAQMFSISRDFALRVLRPALPVAINELLWSLGITTYNAIYGRMGTDSIAAYNVAATFDGLALVLFIGLANATSILVGNQIGAGRIDQAFRYGLRSWLLAVGVGVIVALLLVFLAPLFLQFYNLSAPVLADIRRLLGVIALFLVIRTSNMILYIGIFRAGGDTRFAFVMDGLVIWAVGVPLAALAAFGFGLPVYFVYLFAMSEETIKFSFAVWRFFSRRWIHDLSAALDG
jgi:putative MATE family efflux protein